jgi:hypothetical protein
MPTIPQLPPGQMADPGDEIPVSQNGITRSLTVAEVLTGTQAAIELPSGSLLGRVSLGPGGPEPVSVGIGLVIAQGSLTANGTDQANYVLENAINLNDQVIVNSSGVPSRLPLPLLRGLFTAGTNIAINGSGVISSITDPGVTAELASLTSGLSTTEASLAALEAEIPAGGFVGLNAQGQITNPVAGPVTLGQVQVTASAPSRTLQQMTLDTINVVDFGAVPGGGDCTAAFNAAFAAVSQSGGEIFIPAGDYQLASSLVWPGKALTIRGAGKAITRLHFTHTGIGFDISQSSSTNRVVLRDFSALAENQSGQTEAVARLTFPLQQSFGYVTSFITDIECFGYPNSNNGNPPFPQTFLRGFILINCWSTQVNNVSWFGAPASAGATSSAIIELSGSIDTRITGLQAYYGDTAVLQSDYCEGIYFTNPLIVGMDYLFRQTDITKFRGYTPTKLVLLGLWVANGEVNCNLGTVQASNVGGGYFVGLDITRNGGPNTGQILFDLTNCSSFYIMACNFIGGPNGGNNQDTAIRFQSTFNSSGNVVGGSNFQDMATILNIGNVNATVGLTTFGLNPNNVPIATAFIDNSAAGSGNLVSFQAPATASVPAGIANTKDHVFAAIDGSPLFRINSAPGAKNYIRTQAVTSGNPPTIIFDGTDGTVNGVIQTKGGALFINAAGGSGGSGNLLTLMNIAGATNWIVMQNATSGNLSQITTNSGGIGIQPRGALWLSPSSGLFAPGLPTSKPQVGSNQIWNNGGVLNIA